MFSGVKFPDEGVCRRAFKFYSVTSGCVAADLLRLSYAVAKCRRVPASVVMCLAVSFAHSAAISALMLLQSLPFCMHADLRLSMPL